jgi:catechol 2,3-dioxygenase-like lactoylglutathione lyase family enzyme
MGANYGDFMTKAQVTKDSIDLGIVVCNIENSLAFYKDLLGFELQGTMPMPGGGMMHRLLCGTTTIKLVSTDPSPDHPVGGPITAACGYRYFTISVSNLEEITQACKDAGRSVQVPPTSIRPGVTISIVEDPDGNLVEFLQIG